MDKRRRPKARKPANVRDFATSTLLTRNVTDFKDSMNNDASMQTIVVREGLPHPFAPSYWQARPPAAVETQFATVFDDYRA